MELSEGQISTIEKLAGNHFSTGQIAMVLDIPKREFEALCEITETDPHYKSGHPKYHYDRGILLAKAEVDKGTLKRAIDGNQTSVQ